MNSSNHDKIIEEFKEYISDPLMHMDDIMRKRCFYWYTLNRNDFYTLFQEVDGIIQDDMLKIIPLKLWRDRNLSRYATEGTAQAYFETYKKWAIAMGDKFPHALEILNSFGLGWYEIPDQSVYDNSPEILYVMDEKHRKLIRREMYFDKEDSDFRYMRFGVRDSQPFFELKRLDWEGDTYWVDCSGKDNSWF